MANYAVERYSTGLAQSSTVMEMLETKLETIDATKTIRLLQVISLDRDRDLCIGVLIYDT